MPAAGAGKPASDKVNSLTVISLKRAVFIE
jgi:hypothetical protein